MHIDLVYLARFASVWRTILRVGGALTWAAVPACGGHTDPGHGHNGGASAVVGGATGTTAITSSGLGGNAGILSVSGQATTGGFRGTTAPGGTGNFGAGGQTTFGSVNGGVSGFGGSTTPASTTITVNADGLVSPYRGQYLVVAPDERHVAYIADRIPDDYFNQRCPSEVGKEWFHVRSQGVGTLYVTALDQNGTATTRKLGDMVRHTDYAFSADSSLIVYEDQYDACPVTARLNVARSDGTGSKVLVENLTEQTLTILGRTLFYSTPTSNSAPYARVLPDGEPVLTDIAMYQGLVPSPLGTQAARCDASQHLLLLDTATGQQQVVRGNNSTCGAINWANDGQFLTYQTLVSGLTHHLVVVARDGSVRKEIDTAGLLMHESWSPTGHRLMYDVADGHGSAVIVIHSFDDDSDVVISGCPDPSAYDSWAVFSDDGSRVLVTSAALASDESDLRIAPANTSGTLRFVSSSSQYAASYRGDYIAVANDSDGVVTVVPTAGGTPVAIGSSQQPSYEPATAAPRLLLEPGGPNPQNGFFLAATDGTSVSFINDPLPVSNAHWVGHSVVYNTSSDDGTSFAYRAVNGSGPGSTLLAVRPDTFTYASVGLPSRVFYGRISTQSGLLTGVFVADLPN